MKVFVVGKDSLVGKELIALFQKKSISSIGSGRSEVDITDAETVEKFVRIHNPTHIVNCAAYTNVDMAEVESDLAKKINVDGVIHLSHIAKKRGCFFLHLSTDYVFDGTLNRDYVEEDETRPINVYGKTKCEGETRMLEIYPKACSLRTSSLYGLYKKGLVAHMIETLKREERAQAITDQIASPTYVTDLCEAIYLLLEKKGIYHFANQGVFSRFDLFCKVRDILEQTQVPLRCKEIQGITQKESGRKAIRPTRSVLSTQKIAPLFSKPIRTVEDALKEYVERYHGL